MIITIIILYILFLLSKHERDQIAYHNDECLFPNWHWYSENHWQTKSWWLKNPLSFLLDGWHMMESINVASFCSMTVLIISTLYNIPIWGLILLGVMLYGLIGLIHSILDGSLFRFTNKKE